MTKITQLYVKNYRSLREFSLSLYPLTILIGRNDAGKSNVLKAMQILLNDDASRKIEGYDWNKHVKQKRYPRIFQFEAKLEGSAFQAIRRTVTHKTDEDISTQIEVLKEGDWRVASPKDRVAMPYFYYLRPRTGALQENFNPETENNIFSLIREWMPASFEGEAFLHRLMRKYQPDETNLKAYVKLFESEINRDLALAFPSDFAKLSLQPEYRGPDKGKLISRDIASDTDKVAFVRLPLDHRGTGLISVVAIILSVAVLKIYHRIFLENQPFILGIEEPEVHLHPQAQRSLLEYLRQLSSEQQIIITSHSPLFVDRINPASVTLLRRVTTQASTYFQGSTEAIQHNEESNWTEITKTLGVRLSDALMSGEMNLLVEGETESILIPIMARLTALPFHFDRILVVNGYGGNLPHLARLLQGTGNPTLALVDNDQGGKDIIDNLKAVTPPVKYLRLPMPNELEPPFNKLREVEFEDLLDGEQLLECFNRAFQSFAGYEFLPISFTEFLQERDALLNAGKKFGWVHTMGIIIGKKTSLDTLQKARIEERVKKRILAREVAKGLEAGTVTIPEFFAKIVSNLEGMLQ